MAIAHRRCRRVYRSRVTGYRRQKGLDRRGYGLMVCLFQFYFNNCSIAAWIWIVAVFSPEPALDLQSMPRL